MSMTTTRCLRLLYLLLRRDSQGHPVPAPLPQLRELYQEDEEHDISTGAAARRLERDLQQLRDSGWVVERRGGGRGGACGQVWALLPEPLIV